MEKAVLRAEEYGRIRLRLKEQMDRQGITRGQMARLVGARFEVMDKWYNGTVERMDLDVLARLCYVLECGPGELLEYEK